MLPQVYLLQEVYLNLFLHKPQQCIFGMNITNLTIETNKMTCTVMLGLSMILIKSLVLVCLTIFHLEKKLVHVVLHDIGVYI